MKGKFDLVEETQNDDGTWNLVFDVDDEFQEWFKESQGLKRWSNKRFQKVLHEALVKAVEQGENEVENKAIFKFNNSHGALLCSGCRVILKDGSSFSDEEMAAFQGATELEAQYCNTCEAFRDDDLEESFQGSIAPKEELDRAANEEYNDEVEEE